MVILLKLRYSWHVLCVAVAFSVAFAFAFILLVTKVRLTAART
jgi:hypothetical protein